MTESLDRAELARRLDARGIVLVNRLDQVDHSEVATIDFREAAVLLSALESAERDLAGYGTRGALAYEREERMGNLRLKIEALKERNAWRARAEEAERRIAAVEAFMAEPTGRNGFYVNGFSSRWESLAELYSEEFADGLRAALHPVAEKETD